MSIFFLATEAWWCGNTKSAKIFDLSRHSKSIFSETTCLICSIRIPIDLFGVVTNQSKNSSRFVFLASESWLYQSSKNWLWWWLNLIVKLDILCSYGLVSPNNVSIGKSTVVEEDSIEKVFNLILASKSRCPEADWRFLVLNHLQFQIHVSMLVEACSLPSRSQSEIFDSWQSFR